MPRPPADPNIVLIGARRSPLADLYHRYLELSLGAAMGSILLAIILVNSLFAILYMVSGGVANAAPGSFLDAFSFSMQTLATVGYGGMYPASDAAKMISDVESLVGMMVTAVATGLVFTRFTQTRPALRFTSKIVVCTMRGVPTLMCRVGNDRGNLVVEARARLVMIRHAPEPDGTPFYEILDLPLVRSDSILFTRSWTLMHRITPDSPLYGMDAARLKAEEVEISASLVGVDETSLQTVHARKTWSDEDILIGYRLADLLRALPDGRLEADTRRFDEVTPEA